MFFAVFEAGSHGPAHAAGFEFPLLSTESSALWSRQMTALIWGGGGEVSKPVSESQRGSLSSHTKT